MTSANLVATPRARQERLFEAYPAVFFDRFDVCMAFCGVNEKHCDHYDLTHPILRFAYMGCAVAHGVQWFDDPLLKGLKSVFVSTKTLGDLRHGLEAFYAGFG